MKISFGFLTLLLALGVKAQSKPVSFQKSFSSCPYLKECLIEVPGMKCADNTNSYITVFKRPGANKLLMYLMGGGACWDEKTCNGGFARPLTRVTPHHAWDQGYGIMDKSESTNPFRKNYHIVTVPYCTGDIHSGNKVRTYRGETPRTTVMHYGNKNFDLALKAVKAMIEKPEKAVLMGCSAGGIGTILHLAQFSEAYKDSQRYVISDAGLPFKTPQIPPSRLKQALDTWGTLENIPDELTQGVPDLGDLVKWNSDRYPEVRFGFISSYRDAVMSFFSTMMGAKEPNAAVGSMIREVSDHDIGLHRPDQRVFYTEGFLHCHGFSDLQKTQSNGLGLGRWLTQMTSDSSQWENQRPDLERNDFFKSQVGEPMELTLKSLGEAPGFLPHGSLFKNP